MRSTRFLRLALLGLALGSAAYAQHKKPQEFQPPREMTEEEIAAAKDASKSNLNRYGNDVTDKVSPVPWMAIGLLVLVFAVATPFALRAYRDTASEIRETGGASGGGTPRAPGAVPRKPTKPAPPPDA